MKIQNKPKYMMVETTKASHKAAKVFKQAQNFNLKGYGIYFAMPIRMNLLPNSKIELKHMKTSLEFRCG